MQGEELKTMPEEKDNRKPEFIKMERSYLDWAGNKITELNAEVRELTIKLKKAQGTIYEQSAELIRPHEHIQSHERLNE